MIQAHMSEAAEPFPPVEACFVQIERIIQSPDFKATARERRFLEYIAKETLAGRGSRIKAYSVATEVFGRDASFDPQMDPIVRIEAGQLRRALERYFLMAGQSDPVMVTIPKGAYVPHFSLRERPSAQAESARAPPPAAEVPVRRGRVLWPAAILALLIPGLAVLAAMWTGIGGKPKSPDIPHVLIETFDDLTGTTASAAIARGLTQEVVGQISKFKDVVVVGTGRSVSGAAGAPRFVLAGSVDLSQDAFRLRVRFINRANDAVLWANNYDGKLKVAEVLTAEADIARQVATSLAQTYGVIFQADIKAEVVDPPDDWAAYSCTLSYYAYRATLNPKAHASVRDCLEKATARFPTYATAWGLLSQAYVDDVRFRYPYDATSSPALIERALVAARRAVELDPLNIRGLQAEMFALYFSKEIDAALRVGRDALEINPNDTELIGEYGYRLALSGRWDDGCKLVAEARDRNPGPFAYYESALALCAYFRRDYSSAVMWIKKTTAPISANYHVIAAAIFGEGGYTQDAAREKIWLEKNAPELLGNLRQEVSIRFNRQEDIDMFMASLGKAGLADVD